MPPDLALLSTPIGSNYPCLELIFMVPKVFEPLKFDCTCLEHLSSTRSYGGDAVLGTAYPEVVQVNFASDAL